MNKKVTINVKEGKIRGLQVKSAYSGIEYYSFLGVPYGQSTAGHGRFKDPVQVKPYNSIQDCTSEKGGCYQFSLHEKALIGSEDCLYNNIYTPQLPVRGEPLKAVIVNIHPGGFFHGTPDPSYFGSPDYLMNRDIVYVCVGYRLHMLGHLNLNINGCTGNQSLKDIILSLKWIKENIHCFGGDPENVTLMGSSSGSAVVHFLLLSPQAQGLYHKAVLMGMYVFSPVLITRRENESEAYETALLFGYNGKKEDKKKLLGFLKNLNLTLIVASLENYLFKGVFQVFPTSPFIPTAEPGENSPLPLSPEELIPSTNRVPILIGFCEREGAMALAVLRKLKSSASLSSCFYEGIRQNPWGWGANLTDDDLGSIRKQVEGFYSDGEPIETSSQSTQCDIVTDAALSDVYDSLINVISADLPSSVYLYKFQYDGNLCVVKDNLSKLLQSPLEGAFHGADYAYWCKATNFVDRRANTTAQKDREIIDKFTNFISTFAKTGNPNNEQCDVDWKPTTPEFPCYLNIDNSLEMKYELLNGKRTEFWQEMKNQFKKKL